VTDIPDIKHQIVKVTKSERMKLVGCVVGIGEVQGTQYRLANTTKGSHHVGDLCINERILLKWIVENWGVGVCFFLRSVIPVVCTKTNG
jgi:hypothetical protein